MIIELKEIMKERIDNMSNGNGESGTKHYDIYDDISLVTGLKSKDRVLLVGGNITFPSVHNFVENVYHVKKDGDVKRLLREGMEFDRVFLARENVLDEQLVDNAVKLSGENGLVCFFSDCDALREGFIDVIEQNYPGADVWSLESNVGPVVMTNAAGNPSWQD
jgi:hypothetical protein